jgi:type II secretory ATPase GspE/PulE/Tfp pilus assembly ATPase PilB-like protein
MNNTFTPENSLFFPENEKQLSLMEKHVQESLASQLNINLTSKKANKLRDITCVLAGFSGGYQQLKEYWEDGYEFNNENNFLNICKESLNKGYSEFRITGTLDGYAIKYGDNNPNNGSAGHRVSRDILGNMAMEVEVINELKKTVGIPKSEKLREYYTVEAMIGSKDYNLFIGVNVNFRTNDITLSVKMVSNNFNCLEKICRDALNNNATNINIEQNSDGYTVQFCVGGKYNFESKTGGSSDVFNKDIIKNIKNMANISEHEDMPKNLDIRTNLDGIKFILRISSFQVYENTGLINIKIIKFNEEIDYSLDNMGFRDVDKIKKMAKSKNGLLLVTGVTGSGKSTTVGAIARFLSGVESTKLSSVTTYEKPIEFVYDEINNIENKSIESSFKTGVEALLRRRPEVLLMGNIASPDSLDLAIKASEKCLVIVTMHSNSIEQSRSEFLKFSGGDLFSQIHIVGILHQNIISTGNRSMKMLTSSFVDQDYLSKTPIGYNPDNDGIKIDIYNLYCNGKITKEDIDFNFGEDAFDSIMKLGMKD